jgi:DNA-binding NtrC family response regulator
VRAIVVLHAAGEDRVVRLSGDRAITVGRQFPADVVLEERTLSRQHARFSLRDGELRVQDLDSRNGTWVNDKQVPQAVLRSGETLRLGSLVASVHLMSPRAAAADAGGEAQRQPIVRNARMLELYERIDHIAPTLIPVLILGETGSGKELIAEALHQRSDRRDRPLRVVNCASIPQGLAESVLFGHERGAFTGAHRTADGLFQQADRGVLFLDEVGELSPATQALLLRAVETRTIQPVGSNRALRVDVRIIAATHRNLLKQAAEGGFREDLYYRLNGVTLHVPPLRERSDEIEPLAQRFLAEAARAWGQPLRRLDPALIERLTRLPWPGNVRQLRHVMEHALLACRGDVITERHLPAELLAAAQARPAALAAPASAPAPNDADAHDFKGRVRAYETRLILDALREVNGNQRAAARLLQIPLRTLAHKLNLYDIRALLRDDANGG